MSNEPHVGGTVLPGSTNRTRPEWVDEREYPFESRYFDHDRGRLHYVDEGSGRPVVFLHGNPTWSFVYRDLIEALSDEYRCIAPDYFGFGLSDKPEDWSYAVRDHARVVERFLDDLDLTDATLFLHDWGGPIGANYATRRPERVDSFVVLNTAMWPLNDSLRLRAFSGVMDTPVAWLLNRRYNVPVDWIMPSWFGDRSRFTETARRHYREPLADPEDREGALAFVRELTGATRWLSNLWNRRPRVADKPALICWGMKGPVFGEGSLRRWQALFPGARTVEFPTAGHFVQEERSAALVAETRRFLEQRP